MGKHDPLSIPDAWHQTKLALKKNLFATSRGAEGIQVILEAMAEKCGLDLDEVVAVQPEPEPACPEIKVETTSTPEPEPPKEPDVIESTPEVEVDTTSGPPAKTPTPRKSSGKGTRRVRKPK
jgi:hypothetical protein